MVDLPDLLLIDGGKIAVEACAAAATGTVSRTRASSWSTRDVGTGAEREEREEGTRKERREENDEDGEEDGEEEGQLRARRHPGRRWHVERVHPGPPKGGARVAGQEPAGSAARRRCTSRRWGSARTRRGARRPPRAKDARRAAAPGSSCCGPFATNRTRRRSARTEGGDGRICSGR